jgi:hypothetical protein
MHNSISHCEQQRVSGVCNPKLTLTTPESKGNKSYFALPKPVFLITHFSVLLPSTSRSSEWLVPRGFSNNVLRVFPPIQSTCLVPRNFDLTTFLVMPFINSSLTCGDSNIFFGASFLTLELCVSFRVSDHVLQSHRTRDRTIV